MILQQKDCKITAKSWDIKWFGEIGNVKWKRAAAAEKRFIPCNDFCNAAVACFAVSGCVLHIKSQEHRSDKNHSADKGIAYE